MNKPTYFFQAYQFPSVGDVLTTRQLKQKLSQQCVAEIWPIDAREASVIEYTAWAKTGDEITAYDLNGEPRYWFKIRQIFTDRYVVDEAAWA